MCQVLPGVAGDEVCGTQNLFSMVAVRWKALVPEIDPPALVEEDSSSADAPARPNTGRACGRRRADLRLAEAHSPLGARLKQ